MNLPLLFIFLGNLVEEEHNRLLRHETRTGEEEEEEGDCESNDSFTVRDDILKPTLNGKREFVPKTLSSSLPAIPQLEREREMSFGEGVSLYM